MVTILLQRLATSHTKCNETCEFILFLGGFLFLSLIYLLPSWRLLHIYPSYSRKENVEFNELSCYKLNLLNCVDNHRCQKDKSVLIQTSKKNLLDLYTEFHHSIAIYKEQNR